MTELWSYRDTTTAQTTDLVGNLAACSPRVFGHCDDAA